MTTMTNSTSTRLTSSSTTLLFMLFVALGVHGGNNGYGRLPSFFSQRPRRIPAQASTWTWTNTRRRRIIEQSSSSSSSRFFSLASFVSNLPRGGADESTAASQSSSESSSPELSSPLEQRTQIDVEPTSDALALGETEEIMDTDKAGDDDETEQSKDTIQLNTTTTTLKPSSTNDDQNVTSVNNNNNKSNITSIAPSSSMPLWKQALPAILQKKKKNLVKINWHSSPSRKNTNNNSNNNNDNNDHVVEIYLLGTAHVSNDSSADVKALLQAVQPHCIFVELCEARIPLLTAASSSSLSQQDQENIEKNAKTTATNTSSPSVGGNNTSTISFCDRWQGIQQSQGGSKMQALTSMLLTSVQEDYAETLGVELGGEFRAAHDYWKRAVQQQQQNQPQQSQQRSMMPITTGPPFLVLGDRPVQLTMLRAWESLWWWPKIKVVLGLLWSSVICKPKAHEIRAWLQSILEEHDGDDDKNKDLLTESMAELRQQFPTLYTTIIEERDAWLAAKLVQTCRAMMIIPAPASPMSSPTDTFSSPQQQKRKRPIVVAIVGAGHVPGICAWLTTAPPPTLLPSGALLATAAAAGAASPAALSPEEILLNLTQTKRWAKDEMVQKELIPQWVEQVTQLQDNQDWMWAAAAAAASGSTTMTD